MGESPAGFTLLEALISLAIFAVLLIGILRVYDSTQQSYVRGMAQMDVQQSVRVAIDEIMHDVRLAGYDPSNAINAQTVKYPLQPVSGTTLSTAQLRLVGDVDNNGTSDCTAYRLNNGQILRRSTTWVSGACAWTSTESIVVNNISTFTITYYPATGSTATTDPTVAKRVRVQITGVNPAYAMTFVETSEAILRQ